MLSCIQPTCASGPRYENLVSLTGTRFRHVHNLYSIFLKNTDGFNSRFKSIDFQYTSKSQMLRRISCLLLPKQTASIVSYGRMPLCITTIELVTALKWANPR